MDMEALSKCCGKPMTRVMELGRFVEMECTKCGDRVFVKEYASFEHTSHTGWQEGVAYREA